MNKQESDFLNLENELLHTRQKLNIFIQEYQSEKQNSEIHALFQDKINYLEVELRYLNNQLQFLKQQMRYDTTDVKVSMTDAQVPMAGTQVPITDAQMPMKGTQVPITDAQMPIQGTQVPMTDTQMPMADAESAAQGKADIQQTPKPRDYEKIFGRNFMGIFASVLIFISLIIFATLILPYLTDTMKLIGLYIVSFAILFTGFLFYKKEKHPLFYISIMGCGAGSLYLSLLLSNVYFKVINDITLYLFIFAWAILVKYLTKYKNLVFQIIGQSGILIATILGNALCVHDNDARKLFVLTIFYFLSALVFSDTDKTFLPFFKSLGGRKTVEQTFYEQHLCGHIYKSLNMIVFIFGLMFMESGMLKTVNALLLMLFIFLEFCFAYREECRHGLIFQILTILNSYILVSFWNLTEFFEEDISLAFMYLVALAVLFYVHKKKAGYRLVSEICCFLMMYFGCHNPFIRYHLYAYLTVVPFMLYGKYKKNPIYMSAGLCFVVELLWQAATIDKGYLELLIMTAVVYCVFLYTCRKSNNTCYKIAGYVLLSLLTMGLVHESAFHFMRSFNLLHAYAIEYVSTKASLLSFFVLALLHFILTKTEYFGKEKAIERMTAGMNMLLMIAGCIGMHDRAWKLPTIIITTLLFVVNSKKLIQKDEKAGYYIALKYTALMVCILTSYDVTDYLISICLLLFAIANIGFGFYKDTNTFRLYGLALSMISVFKLIMIDIQYDSTLENAVSFFVCGILCFVISFLYHKIDTSLKKK